ncbi:S9 family peptidase [Sphingobium aquiterrae]|uniref:S9 family peptidase n=1 Tax=Sphingobium aquiterrae TaxID=2038656 RepID=UPI00301B28FF
MPVAAPIPAPVPAPTPLTLERLFASPDLSGSQPRALRLSPDGALLTLLKPRPDDRERLDLWAIDTKTGAERMLVDSAKVGTGAELSEAEKMQRERARIGGSKGIVAYDWAPDGKSILVPLDGDLYLATLDGNVRRLTATPEGELNAAVSPAGAYISFVREQNLYVQKLSGGNASQITTDGGGTVHWGEAEFVAQEEMDRRTGYWWAPGDTLVAIERFDEAPVGVVTRAAIGADGTKVYDQRYPAAGTPNVTVDLYVMRPDGSKSVKVDLGTDADIYLARVDWARDGKTLYVQRENRAQTRLDVLKVDPLTGKSSILFTEKAAAKSWINLNDAFRQMKDGSFLWQSERDGYNHFYRFANGRWSQLTRGAWVTTKLVGVDEAKGLIYFMGNKDDPLEHHLYSVEIGKPGSVTRLTEPGWWNAASMDDAATRFIISRSNPRQPSQTYLADITGQKISWINENAVVEGHPYFPFLASHQETKFGTIKAKDGTTLYWEMITPPLEPGKLYPVFFEHYGGPGTGQQVTRGWQGGRPQYLVDKGWIYFQIDNRGSYNRGKEFEDQIWHAMGTVEVEDQLAGAEFLRTQPFVDASKIATFGWSYGGYMSLKLLEKSHGVFAAAIAGAPVTDWTLYDTHYTERYLGDPKAKDSAYPASGALLDATKISDPLLLLHGMSDDNVVLDNSTRFMTKMQQGAVPFQTMLYPGQTHRVGGPGISVHLWKTIEDFLDEKVLKKGGMVAAAPVAAPMPADGTAPATPTQ